jgi:pantoate--beta-alanine ligase
MRTSHSITEWRKRRQELHGRTVGFVPTMGALHSGHAALVTRCRAENDIVVASIFVNPTQFNDPRDLTRYPRTLDQDLQLLESLGTDDVFIPSAADMYPDSSALRIIPSGVAPVMESRFRPGFLEGVLTVVLKLLNLVQPTRSYFGEKDYQQLRAVTELAQTFFCTTEVVPCPTVRDASGLALSSRNALLSPEGRAKAARIFESLTTSPDCASAERMLRNDGFEIDYVEEHWGRRLAAVHLEGVRLIDNVPLPNTR